MNVFNKCGNKYLYYCVYSYTLFEDRIFQTYFQCLYLMFIIVIVAYVNKIQHYQIQLT